MSRVAAHPTIAAPLLATMLSFVADLSPAQGADGVQGSNEAR
jgi:hypothetical protein